jgi:hypothetical protein
MGRNSNVGVYGNPMRDMVGELSYVQVVKQRHVQNTAPRTSIIVEGGFVVDSLEGFVSGLLVMLRMALQVQQAHFGDRLVRRLVLMSLSESRSAAGSWSDHQWCCCSRHGVGYARRSCCDYGLTRFVRA